MESRSSTCIIGNVICSYVNPTHAAFIFMMLMPLQMCMWEEPLAQRHQAQRALADDKAFLVFTHYSCKLENLHHRYHKMAVW